MSLIQSFTPEAGKGFADAWIRREISNNLADLRTGTYVTKPGTTLESSAEIFLTCDLMNALAGVAEGINTLYFYRIEDDGGRIKPRQGYDSLASLIVNTAIQLDECKSTIPSYNKIREYHASWHGKSGFEWQNDIVHVEDLA